MNIKKIVKKNSLFIGEYILIKINDDDVLKITRKNNNKLVFFGNIILFIINIYYLFVRKTNNNLTIIDISKNSFNFKNTDEYIINLLKNSYTTIGNYLNNKYNNSNSSHLIPKKEGQKKVIRLHAVNLNSKEEFRRTLLWYLQDKFIIVFDQDNPDYLVYNVFGLDEYNKKYDNCIKIAVYTENTIPDLSMCDYALGHAHISYSDRYYTLPFCFIRRLNETKNLYLTKIRKAVIKKPRRKKFCAALITNVLSYIADFFRLKFIDELNKYKLVDMGGNYKNNVGGRVKNKMKFLLDYKFSIAMENTNGDGYVSEKIIDAFASGTIPIYYGSYMIDEYINPKSYILVKGPEDMKEKIEYIKKIDNDDSLYESIIREKVYIDKTMLKKALKEQSDFWIHIFEQDKDKAKRNFIKNFIK